MRKFTRLEGLVAPLDRANVDTDAIIAKQFLKSIKRSGFGVNLFDAWRYLDHGEPGMDNGARKPNPDFVLNQPRYKGANILVARKNFGCGSSREHAPWALDDYGFRALIAPSYADIFYNNCFKNGLLPIVLPEIQVDRIFHDVAAFPGFAALSSSNQKAFVKAAQWIAPGEADAPSWLAAIVDFESGKSWSPSTRNPFSRAVGLIQFIEPTARALGTTTDALAAMSFAQQLEYVKRYFAEIAGTRGKIHSLGDMYLSVFTPRGVGMNPSTVLYSAGQAGYDQNAGLDHGSKGYITVGDVIAAPTARLASVADLAPVLVNMGIGLGTLTVLALAGYGIFRYWKGG